MKHIQKLIPSAIDAVKLSGITDEKNQVPSEFNGYISSFGASIISSGLLPSIIYYSQKKSANEDRTQIIKAIEYIIRNNFDDSAFSLLTSVKTLYSQESLDFREIGILTTKVENALIALKLAIRIYKPKPKENHEH
jgi:CRISPR/Cas system CMR-associated protein Cmr5 small subunit